VDGVLNGDGTAFLTSNNGLNAPSFDVINGAIG